MLKFKAERNRIFKTYEKMHNGAVINQFNSRTKKIRNIWTKTKLILRIKIIKKFQETQLMRMGWHFWINDIKCQSDYKEQSKHNSNETGWNEINTWNKLTKDISCFSTTPLRVSTYSQVYIWSYSWRKLQHKEWKPLLSPKRYYITIQSPKICTA